MPRQDAFVYSLKMNVRVVEDLLRQLLMGVMSVDKS